jgi:predicted aspartyl protease
MRFSYREYLAQVPGSSDFRLFVRPIINIRIRGEDAEVHSDALVDTGADETLLPLSYAGALGVELDWDSSSQAEGISGEKLAIYYGDVEIEIEQDGERITWKTTVGFADFGSPSDEVAILGHGGCLEYFTATFDGEKAELELIPNSWLPTS